MKRSLLLLSGFATMGLYSFSQQIPVSQSVQKRVALLEELTGINCQYCPDGHRVANEISADNPGKVVVVNIHAGSFASPGSGQPNLRTTDGTAINSFFNPDGYPTGSVHRTASGSPAKLYSDRGQWSGQVNSVIGENSPVNIAMSASINHTTRVAEVKVEMYYTTPQAAGTIHKLNVGILQDDYQGPQSGMSYNPSMVLSTGKYLHQHMFRGFINADGTWGESIDASQTGVITKTYTYTIPENINSVPMVLGDLEFYAFLHEGKNGVSNSKAITSAKIKPTHSNIPSSEIVALSLVGNYLACSGSTITPVIKVKNNGSPVTAMKYTVQVGSGATTEFTWGGNIAAFATADLTLQPVTVSGTANTIVKVAITEVNNGAGTVGSVSNLSKTVTLSNITAEYPTGLVKCSTDAYGSETSWVIFDSNNQIAAQGGPYNDANGPGTYVQNEQTFGIVPNECYRVELYDEYGDGFTSSQYGNGSFQVLSGGVSLINITSFTTGSLIRGFKSAAVLGIGEQLEAATLAIYPNPATDKINVSLETTGGDFEINVTDLQGRIILTENFTNLNGAQNIEMNTSSLKAGNYMVNLVKDGVSTTKMIAIK